MMILGMEKLLTCDPSFLPKARAVVLAMAGHGWNLRVVWCLRTFSENQELVLQGKASRDSLHLTGRALDLIDRAWLYDAPHNHPYYMQLRAAAHANGLRWGGDFMSRWDPTHVDMPW